LNGASVSCKTPAWSYIVRLTTASSLPSREGESAMVSRAKALCASIVIASAGLAGPNARAADTPMIETVLDARTGTVLWQSTDASRSALLKPGQAIILRGHDFGPGPITATPPGFGPPAGGMPPGDGTTSVIASPPEPANRELSKILFGNVRAMERNL